MDERDVHIKEINRIQAERDEARAELAVQQVRHKLQSQISQERYSND